MQRFKFRAVGLDLHKLGRAQLPRLRFQLLQGGPVGGQQRLLLGDRVLQAGGFSAAAGAGGAKATGALSVRDELSCPGENRCPVAASASSWSRSFRRLPISPNSQVSTYPSEGWPW